METLEMVDRLQVNGEVTILDVLGVDLCRDAILDNVHIRDIVRSERVCRRWQRAVLGYLPRCRHLTLSIHQRSRVFKHSHRTVMIRDDGTFPVRNVLEKLGPLIVNLYTNRSDKEFYENIALYCPHLRQLQLKHLTRDGISEQKLGRAFQTIQLEKLKLVKCQVSGKFLHLMNLNSLKSLSLITCEDLRYRHIESNASRLQNVTSLEILGYSQNIPNVLMLIKGMPKLENICLKDYTHRNGLVPACSQLNNLRRIVIRGYGVDDDFLEGIASSCSTLEYLNINGIIQSPYGPGLAALIIRPSPSTLLCFSRVREEHIETLLEYLQHLNIELESHGRKKITLEMLNESFKLMEKCDPLQLRLVNPAVRRAKSHPELTVILNVSFDIISQDQENVNAPDNVEVDEDWMG